MKGGEAAGAVRGACEIEFDLRDRRSNPSSKQKYSSNKYKIPRIKYVTSSGKGQIPLIYVKYIKYT